MHQWFASCALVALVAVVWPGVASAQTTVFSFDGYAVLEAAIVDADAVREQSAEGSDQRREATAASLAARRSTLTYLTDWIASGTLPAEYVEYANGARLILMQNMTLLSAELGRCGEADSLLLGIEPMRASDDPEWVVAFDAARSAVDGCESAQTGTLQASVAPEPDEPAASESTARAANLDRRDGPGAGPVALVASGAVMTVVGVGWNLALLDDRAEHRRLTESCALGGVCEAGRANRLRDRLDGAKAPVAALVAIGAATTAAGAVWWRLSNQARGSDVAWGPPVPVMLPGGAGGAVEVRW